MKTPAYSSLTAFLAHLRALRALTAPAHDQAGQLADMQALLAELAPGEREVLEGGDTSGAGGRHRQRAERHLSRILRERGVLAG